MVLDPLSVSIVLDQIICHDEGADPGTGVEPYLYTIFFKVDGNTVALRDPDLTLSGEAVMLQLARGSHGNLGTRQVDTDDQVPIPAAIGRAQTDLQAIPVDPALQQPGTPDRVSGVVSVACWLLEEDQTPDRVAEANRAGLNTRFPAKLNRIVDGTGTVNAQPGPEDINGIAGKLRQAIGDLVQEEARSLQDFLNGSGFLNDDDFIGAVAFSFTHSSLGATPSQPFSRRFQVGRVGDWEIRGRVIATRILTQSPPIPAGRQSGTLAPGS